MLRWLSHNLCFTEYLYDRQQSEWSYSCSWSTTPIRAQTFRQKESECFRQKMLPFQSPFCWFLVLVCCCCVACFSFSTWWECGTYIQIFLIILIIARLCNHNVSLKSNHEISTFYSVGSPIRYFIVLFHVCVSETLKLWALLPAKSSNAVRVSTMLW